MYTALIKPAAVHKAVNIYFIFYVMLCFVFIVSIKCRYTIAITHTKQTPMINDW